LFILGTDGLLGSDDVLACFAAGNVFTWDDWFRLETQDDSLQPSIDMILNVTVFVWFGAVCPWYDFAHRSDLIPIYRLIPLGILVLLLRRPPVLWLLHKRIHQTTRWRQASIVGFFGPIGVGAIFYLSISQEYLRELLDENGEPREDAVRLRELMTVIIWFLVVCSIVSYCSVLPSVLRANSGLFSDCSKIVHGLTIPLVKVGIKIPLAFSEDSPEDTEGGMAGSKQGGGEGQTRQQKPAPAHLSTSNALDREVGRSNHEGQVSNGIR